jgi:glycosyltransferase involved in cell wall biosynthesis
LLVSTIEVVVPAYNETGRIGPTVTPLLDRFAILMVDDGSTDDTALEAREAGARVV